MPGAATQFFSREFDAGTAPSSKAGHEFHELTQIDSNRYEVRDNLCNSCLKSRHGRNEKRASSNWRHWRERPLSDGRAARCDRAQHRHTVRCTIGHSCRRKSKRASCLFFAAPRPRSSDSAARTQSPGQYLCAAFAQRPLDHLSGSRGQFAGKICAARYLVAFAVLRSHESARCSYIFRRGHCCTYRVRGTDQHEAAKSFGAIGENSRSHGTQWRHLREYGWTGIFNTDGIGIQSAERFRRDRNDESSRSEVGTRSRNRVRGNGNDHRLRLLENGRRSGLRTDGPRSSNGECGDSEETTHRCNPTHSDGAKLAGALRSGFGAGHRPQALAGCDGRKVETDFGTVSGGVKKRAPGDTTASTGFRRLAA